MAGKTLNVLLLEDFLLLVSVSSGSGVKFGYTVFVLFFFFSSKADSTADDASNKLAQV